MSDKALVKVHFVPFVMILLLKLLCMKWCLIVTSVTIHILFKCIHYFTLFLIRNSSPTSCLSIHIKADKIQTSKGLNCLIHFSSSQRTKNILSSSLGVFVVPCSLQGKFSTLTFCFTHSFLHCYKWIHETVLFFFFFVSKIECSSVTEQ